MPRGEWWTTKEEKKVNYFYGTIPVKELAEMLGRSPRAIRTKAYKMGLTDRDMKNSSPARVKYSREKIKHYVLDRELSCREISEIMGCDIRRVLWIVKNEFSEFCHEQLIKNGKRAYREARKKKDSGANKN